MPKYLGPHQIGQCQRCGFKRLRIDLIEDGYLKNVLVCKDSCYDEDHPQRYPPLERVEGIAPLRPAPPQESLTPPVLTGRVLGDGHGHLTWTAAVSPDELIDRYEVFRSPLHTDEFTLIATVDVVYDDVGAVLDAGTSYTDLTANFATNYYYYFVIAYAVTRETGQSNTIPLATPPAPVVLSGNYAIPNIDLTWTASGSDSNTIERYVLYRSVDQGVYTEIDTTLPADPREYLDTDTQRNNHRYDYKVIVYDSLGIASDASNVVTFLRLAAFFVAAGNVSTTQLIATSQDGVTWTLRTTPTSPGLIGGICFAPALGRIMAVGNGGGLSSDNGTTWTTRTMPLVQWMDVDWSPTLNLFVAIADGATGFGAATSPDGITWTLRATPNRGWACVKWFAAAGLFVAGATTGGVFLDTGRIMTSPDGINWTLRTSPLISGVAPVVLYRCATSPTRMVFTSRQNFGQTYSDDGINWTFNSDGLGGSAWLNIAYGSGLGLWAASGSSFTMTRSPTGANPWTGGVSTKNVEGLAYSPELNMFVGGNTSSANFLMNYSLNGINWNLASTPAGMNANNWNSVCAAVFPIP